MKLKNNATSIIQTNIESDSSSFLCKIGEGELFPTENFEVFLEYFEDKNITKRESIFITSRVGDVFNIGTRAYNYCVQNDNTDPKIRSKEVLEFPAGSQISQYVSEKYLEDLENKVNSKLDKTDEQITKQGNEFNGNGQLVKLDENGKLPELDGSNLTNLTMSADNFFNTFSAGESISSGEAVRFGQYFNKNIVNLGYDDESYLAVGLATNKSKVGQKIVFENKIKLKSIELGFSSYGTVNSGNYYVKLYDSIGGSVLATSEAVTASTILQKKSKIIFNFNDEELEAGDKYFEVSTDRSNDHYNYYKVYFNRYRDFNGCSAYSINSSGNWEEYTNRSLGFKLDYLDIGENLEKVYKTDSGDLEKIDFLGIALESKNKDENIKICMLGLVNTLSDLKIGKKYYIGYKKTGSNTIDITNSLTYYDSSGKDSSIIFVAKFNLIFNKVTKRSDDLIKKCILQTLEGEDIIEASFIGDEAYFGEIFLRKGETYKLKVLGKGVVNHYYNWSAGYSIDRTNIKITGAEGRLSSITQFDTTKVDTVGTVGPEKISENYKSVGIAISSTDLFLK